jgi:hypothetical protein
MRGRSCRRRRVVPGDADNGWQGPDGDCDLYTDQNGPGLPHAEPSSRWPTTSHHSHVTVCGLSGSPPHGKVWIPLERRDVRVVEGAHRSSSFVTVIAFMAFSHPMRCGVRSFGSVLAERPRGDVAGRVYFTVTSGSVR